MAAGLVFLVALLALPAPCASTKRAKRATAIKKGDSLILTLQGGREVKGIYLESKDGAVWVAVDQGEIGVDSKTIAKMSIEESDTAEFQKRRNALKEKDLEGHYALAQWARLKGLESSAVAEIKHILALEPSHSSAHFFLGHIQLNGKWITREEALALGMYDNNGRWSFWSRR